MKQIFRLKEPIGKINEPAELFKHIQEINIDYHQENFMVFCLNAQSQIIKGDVLFKGGLSECLIDAKIIFRFALIENASKIILAHNHPSNNLEPSQEDRNVFNQLKEVGEKIGLPVIDSIIFNPTEFYSLCEVILE